MILLDTNVLSELMRPNPDGAVVAWMDAQPASTLFTSSITRAEIELGIALLDDGKRKETLKKLAQEMFEMFSSRCLSFGEMAAIQYGTIVAHRVRNGRPIATEDAQIASVAIGNGLRLATRNVKDFEAIPNLVIVNPWQSS